MFTRYVVLVDEPVFMLAIAQRRKCGVNVLVGPKT